MSSKSKRVKRRFEPLVLIQLNKTNRIYGFFSFKTMNIIE